jgi:plastocyanin
MSAPSTTQKIRVVVTKAGTYTIVCDVHAPGMKMTVKVS